MSAQPVTSETLPQIAFEHVPLETYSFVAVEPEQLPTETVIVEYGQIEGVTVMPGTDLELLYGKPTIWDSPWFVGGLMTLGILAILGAVQVLLHRLKAKNQKSLATVVEPVAPAVTVVTGAGEPIRTPIAGVVTKVNVLPGQRVEQGQPLCVMETWLSAPRSGVVTQVSVPVGTVVGSGTPIFTIQE